MNFVFVIIFNVMFILNILDFQLLFSTEKHDFGCYSILRVSENIITGLCGYSLEFWNMEARKEKKLNYITNIYENQGIIEQLNSTTLIVSQNFFMSVINFINYEKINFYGGHKKKITALLKLENNLNFVSGSEDGEIKLWNISTLTNFFTISNNNIAILKIIDIGNNFIAGLDSNGFLNIWNIASGQKTQSIKMKYSVLSLIYFTNDVLISGSADGEIFFFNILSGEQSINYKTIKCNTPITSLLKINATFIASGNGDGSIKIWNVHTGNLEFFYKNHLDVISSLVLINKNIIVSSSLDKTIKSWFMCKPNMYFLNNTCFNNTYCPNYANCLTCNAAACLNCKKGYRNHFLTKKCILDCSIFACNECVMGKLLVNFRKCL